MELGITAMTRKQVSCRYKYQMVCTVVPNYNRYIVIMAALTMIMHVYSTVKYMKIGRRTIGVKAKNLRS